MAEAQLGTHYRPLFKSLELSPSHAVSGSYSAQFIKYFVKTVVEQFRLYIIPFSHHHPLQ